MVPGYTGGGEELGSVPGGDLQPLEGVRLGSRKFRWMFLPLLPCSGEPRGCGEQARTWENG